MAKASQTNDDTVTYTAGDLARLSEILEPDDLDLMVRLGVRPAHYSARNVTGTHPDRRPCPSWCSMGQSEEDDHEIDPKNPMVATHSIAIAPTTVASHYLGTFSGRDNAEGGRVVRTATIETWLTQQGQVRPRIQLFLRHYPDGNHKLDRRLSLSVQDAKDLLVALTYVVQMAEAG